MLISDIKKLKRKYKAFCRQDIAW